MTIKKRLFLSNLFMLLIPALVSVLILALSMLLFVNLFYKQAMDETVHGENTVYLEHLLVKQAEEFLQTDHKVLTDSHLYQTVEKYVQTQSIQLQIYDGDALVCSMGDRHEDLAEMPLYMLSNGNVYVEPITIDDHNYTIYIAFFAPVQESTWNEMIVKYLIAVLIILIVIAVLVTNRFLTKFVFRKIEKPLDILISGVHEIQDGNLAYRIRYSNKDEFLPVCQDFNQMAERLQQSIAQTEREERNRKELIAGISHDLRTPLTMMKAYAEMIRDLSGNNPVKREQHLNIIIEETDRLTQLVNDMLDLSKLESGAQKLDYSTFDIAQCMEEIVHRYEGVSERMGYHIHLTLDKSCMVRCDESKIDRVIGNLINNAINYTSKEDKQVFVTQRNLPQCVRIEVRDTGDGIEEDKIKLIFDKYYRSENHKREVVGTGLGLSIVKEILKMHNYNYGVNSKLGEGSTFWFEIRDIVPPDTAEQPESEIQ